MTGQEELPPLLSVGDVQRRYGMRDPRAARRLMYRAGGFNVARRLVIRADVLDAWERARHQQPGEGLTPGWWRESA